MIPAPTLPPDDPTLRRFLREVWAKTQRTTWVRYVDTQSMAPSLRGPVDLLIAWGKNHTLHPGDLILFEDPVLNILVAHRVCRVDVPEGHILQTGDRLLARGIPGNWVGADALFGKVLALRWPTNPCVVRLNHPGVTWIGRQIAWSSAQLWQQTRSGPFAVSTRHRVWCWAYHISLFLFQERPNASYLAIPKD